MSCTFDGCQKPHYAKGWCKGHYTQAWKGRPLTPLLKPSPVCAFDGCDRRHYSHGWCQGHYSQWYKGREMRPLRSTRTGCEVSGCDRDHYCKGMCSKHYRQTLAPKMRKPSGKRGRPRMKDDDGFCYTCDAIKVMHGRGDNLKRICDALGMTLSGLEKHARRHGLGSQMAAEFRTARRSDAA